MLQYLQEHSRPEITDAVSVCAYFVHSQRRSHKIELELIEHYLKCTSEEGLILIPLEDLDVDVYLDTNFSVLWIYEDKHNPTCVKIRNSFVV